MAKRPKKEEFKTFSGKEELVVEGLPCRQCHNTGGCIRGGKCEKGFIEKPKE